MTRTWWENEEILKQFGDWLTQTDDEIHALDADGRQGAKEIRSAHAEPLPKVGLLQFVETFTALRHELKLQTKGTRGLEDAVASAVSGLDVAMAQFRSVQAREQESADRAATPLVEALVGLDEALHRGAQAFQMTHRKMTQSAPLQFNQTLDQEFAKLPAWRRWLGRHWHNRVKRVSTDSLARITDSEFASLMQGYELIQMRMQRALVEHDICRIDCVGCRVDPSRMAVVELVDDEHAAPETVVDEVRPGYTWRGQIVRFAEVRAVRSQLANREDDAWPTPPIGSEPVAEEAWET